MADEGWQGRWGGDCPRRRFRRQGSSEPCAFHWIYRFFLLPCSLALWLEVGLRRPMPKSQSLKPCAGWTIMFTAFSILVGWRRRAARGASSFRDQQLLVLAARRLVRHRDRFCAYTGGSVNQTCGLMFVV